MSDPVEGAALGSAPEFPNWAGRTILFVMRSLDMGGTQRQVGHLAPWLQNETQARVAVWALERGGPLAAKLESHGIAWELHDGLLRTHGLAKLVALLRLLQRIRKLKPDVILSFNDFPNKVCGAIWPWSKARTCVWNQRDEGREVTGRFLERRALRQVNVFTANSLQGVEFLAGRFGISRERIHLVPNGVSLDPPARTRDDWRAAIGIGRQVVMVTMIANLHKYKDHETLLRAWALVTGAGNGPHLVLAGQHRETFPRLQDFCRLLGVTGSVHFIGPTDDVSGLLAASDIGVFSSRLEGMPNGVLESMAAGLPVVATRIAGITAALGDDYPLQPPPGDVPALARDLLVLIRDTALRERIGRQNKMRARDEFSVENMGRRYGELLYPLLAKHHGRSG
jgi:glycosyltransferase involved in cell wall biosynthesis